MPRQDRLGGPAVSEDEWLADRECECGWTGETTLYIYPGTGEAIEFDCPDCRIHHLEEGE